jgi:hypothetical protein
MTVIFVNNKFNDIFKNHILMHGDRKMISYSVKLYINLFAHFSNGKKKSQNYSPL